MIDEDNNQRIEKALLDLISAEFTDSSGNIDWNSTFLSAKKHAVIGITSDVLPDSIPEKTMNKWFTYAAKQLQVFHSVLYVQNRMTKILNKAEIGFVILKGVSVAAYYSCPEKRSMADIDLAVLPEDFERAQTTLSDAGFEVKERRDVTSRHSVLLKSGIHIELHHHFSHESDDDAPIDAFIRNGIKNAGQCELYGYAFPVLPPVENGLVILYHISRQLYMGVGLRNIVDWCEYVRNMPSGFWENGFEEAAKECGLDKFAAVLTGVCVKYLGLSDEGLDWCAQDCDGCELLIKDCMAAGNDGFSEVSSSMMTKSSVKMKRKGVFKYLQEAGLYNWKYAHRHKWVRPFAWIYQLFRCIIKLFKNRKNIKNEIGISNERAELLKKVGL